MTLQFSLKNGTEASLYTFSRTWTPPCTTLRLATGPLALLKVCFLVADEGSLAVEDLLLGLPVLRHLGIDTKTLLEERREELQGMDCSTVTGKATESGRLRRLMVVRLNHVSNEDVANTSRFSFEQPPPPC